MKSLVRLNKLINGLTVSLEDNTDGKNRTEKEYVYYIKLDDIPKFIENYKDRKESQEQYEIKIPKVPESLYTSRIRVRNINNGDEYILCMKAHSDNQDTIENEMETTIEFYNLFKAITIYGLKKDRYTLPIGETGLNWQVDILHKNDGSFNEWVKIDLEVPTNYNEELPSINDFFSFSKCITNQWGQRPEEEEKLLKEIYESYRYKGSV